MAARRVLALPDKCARLNSLLQCDVLQEKMPDIKKVARVARLEEMAVP